MANTFNGKFSVVSDFKYSSSLDIGSAIHTVLDTNQTDFIDGEDANQAEVAFTDQRTLGISSNEELDLSGTSLQDAFGNDIAFTSVKVMIVKADSANDDNLLVGGAAANAWSTWASDDTDEIVVKPGGTFVVIAPDASGYAVTSGTGDLLRIENASGSSSATYDLILVGIEA